MKILEAQNATLSNYEVYTFLQEQRTRYQKTKQQGHYRPGNLMTLMKEVGEEWVITQGECAEAKAHS